MSLEDGRRPASEQRQRRSRPLRAVFVAIVVLALAGAVVVGGVLYDRRSQTDVSVPGASAGSDNTSQGEVVTGTITVDISSEPITFTPGVRCLTPAGYSDISAGTQVTVKNQEGTVVATGALGPGTTAGYSCAFPFEISNVPRASFYQLEVSHRGVLSYSYDEMAARGWHVDFSLGT